MGSSVTSRTTLRPPQREGDAGKNMSSLNLNIRMFGLVHSLVTAASVFPSHVLGDSQHTNAEEDTQRHRARVQTLRGRQRVAK